MSITYRQHQDTRDGKIYNCVLMPDGKWWSAVDLDYGGAGYYYNNDPALGAIYGRLYTWEEALVACPPGSHLPGDPEWTTLETAISAPDGTKLKANSALWTINTGTDDYGFAALPGGHYDYNGEFVDIKSLGLFWTSTVTGSGLSYNRKIRILYGNNPSVVTSVVSGVSAGAYAYKLSVRFIVDVFNEPIPPTKIKGAFSGSGVKAYFTNHNTATLELPISAQTTTELTIDKDFISFWGPSLGNVRILVVDGEYISEWKDWNFNA